MIVLLIHYAGSDSGGSMSDGVIALISICVVLGVSIMFLGGVFYSRHRQNMAYTRIYP